MLLPPPLMGGCAGPIVTRALAVMGQPLLLPSVSDADADDAVDVEIAARDSDGCGFRSHAGSSQGAARSPKWALDHRRSLGGAAPLRAILSRRIISHMAS